MATSSSRRRLLHHLDVVQRAWDDLADGRAMVHVVEVSAFVSTNHVYRVRLDDGSHVIAKVSNYGSYYMFREDHDRLHRCVEQLATTRFAGFMADVLTKGGRVYTFYDGLAWAAFYHEVERRESLPRILTEAQVDNAAEEVAGFHLACADAARHMPVSSKSIKSDAVHLLDLLTAGNASRKFAVSAEDRAFLARQTEGFLAGLDSVAYDTWPKIPVLIDWNLGNFSVSTDPGSNGSSDRFHLFSRWDYDWFRIDTRLLDFYFLSRVSSRTGDRTHFTYSSHTLLEPRFVRFLQAYHRVMPLTATEVCFLKEAYRFFILNYVVREGGAFFAGDLLARLQHEAVNTYLPALDALDLGPLVEALGLG